MQIASYQHLTHTWTHTPPKYISDYFLTWHFTLLSPPQVTVSKHSLPRWRARIFLGGHSERQGVSGFAEFRSWSACQLLTCWNVEGLVADLTHEDPFIIWTRTQTDRQIGCHAQSTRFGQVCYARLTKEVVEKFIRNLRSTPSPFQVRARVIQADTTRELREVLASCEGEPTMLSYFLALTFQVIPGPCPKRTSELDRIFVVLPGRILFPDLLFFFFPQLAFCC